MLNALTEAKTWLNARYPHTIDIGVVLGSGISLDDTSFNHAVSVSYADIPYFPKPRVEGHAGRLTLCELPSGQHVALFGGRVHYYEGHSPEAVVFPMRLLKLLGAKRVILTNAAGGVDPTYAPGDLMLITDHLNLTGFNPLRGDNIDTLGPRFPDMTEAYSHSWGHEALAEATTLGLSLKKGVYAGVSGPSYETPAEVQMLHRLGASAVGMSTVAETIVARHMGLEVLGISMISNAAAGLGNGEALSHEDVLAVGKQASIALSKLLLALLSRH